MIVTTVVDGNPAAHRAPAHPADWVTMNTRQSAAVDVLQSGMQRSQRIVTTHQHLIQWNRVLVVTMRVMRLTMAATP
jgi:hypothetical protein